MTVALEAIVRMLALFAASFAICLGCVLVAAVALALIKRAARIYEEEDRFDYRPTPPIRRGRGRW